ncbi:MAG: ADP-forming succinate--CoA ligase subunit beta [Desulfobulbaceae bacterium]|nr:ADP-forming succinate--CoA ligase subunit beta [Desulfobulbaceae bacterium]
MKIHEFQAKELFRGSGLPVPAGKAATTVEEAVDAADSLGYPAAVKAQVHAGGRGKAGGIRIVHNRDEAGQAAAAILGMTLQTAQTGGQGRVVSRVLVEQGQKIERELYLSILPDRASARVMVIASTAGGMDIEEVAAKTPEKIIRITVDPLTGIQPFHLRQAAFGLGLTGELFKTFGKLLKQLYRVVVDNDLLLAEINPLAVTKNGKLTILDAKVDIDASALFRHSDLAALHDPKEDDPLEVAAAQYNLNYIRLDGNIGNMVNGAGLAMATMDMIKQAGAEPANFLDVGGGASAEMIENGFRILLSDTRVKAILINIFGGILRCDVLAEGVVEAANKVGLGIPVVVRMEGTNVEKGRKILADSGLDLITAVDLADAADKISTIAGRA